MGNVSAAVQLALMTSAMSGQWPWSGTLSPKLLSLVLSGPLADLPLVMCCCRCAMLCCGVIWCVATMLCCAVCCAGDGSADDGDWGGGIGIWSIAWSPQGGQLIAGGPHEGGCGWVGGWVMLSGNGPVVMTRTAVSACCWCWQQGSGGGHVPLQGSGTWAVRPRSYMCTGAAHAREHWHVLHSQCKGVLLTHLVCPTPPTPAHRVVPAVMGLAVAPLLSRCMWGGG